MYSIQYLYQIRNNFAIIYHGFDSDFLQSLKSLFFELKEKNTDINLFLFIEDDILDVKNNIYHANMFSDMRSNFIKYFEIPKNANNEYNINKIL